MTIGRIHFEDGIILDPAQKDIHEQAIDAAKNNFTHLQILPEGYYNLTPPQWENNAYEHVLTVRGDGTGAYTLRARYHDSGSTIIGIEDTPRPGDRVTRIPQDRELVLLAGPDNSGKSLMLHEIVLFTPGASPKKK